MRLLCILSLLLTCAFSLPALADEKNFTEDTVQILLKNQQFEVHAQGKVTALNKDMYPLLDVKNGVWKYLPLSADDAKKHKLKAGVYLFSPDKEEPVAFFPTENAEFCGAVYASPSKKIIAIDYGTSMQRDIEFYSLPEGKKLGETAYYMDSTMSLIWKEDSTGVVFASMEDREKEKRPCQYDPCGALSTKYFSFLTNKASLLQTGTTLCDYKPKVIKGNELEVASLCFASAKDWEMYPEMDANGSFMLPLPE